MRLNSDHWKPLLVGILLMSLTSVLEIYTGLLLGCVGYIFITLYILWFLRTSRLLTWLGVISSFYIITSTTLLVVLQSDVARDYTHLLERALSLFAVWFAIFFTDRYRKLHEEEKTIMQQTKAIFENANEGILFSNQAGEILLANPYAEKMLGYRPDELPGKNIRDLMPSQYTDSHSHYVASFISKPENKMISRILRAKTKEGKELPVEINLSHFYQEAKLTIIVFIQDATYKNQQLEYHKTNLERVRHYNLELSEKVEQRTLELEQSNLELRKSQQLYQSMARNFPYGIIGVLDKNMRYVLADGKGMAQLGLNPENIIGNRLFDDVYETENAEAEEKLSSVFKGYNVNFDLYLKDRYYNISSVPLVDANGDVHEILVVIKDISSRKKFEEKLVRTIEKEKDLNVMKSRFVSMASHEFRTPLTTILSSVFLLENYKGEQLERESKKLLERIKRAVHNMTEILNEFLSSGKLDEGKMPVYLNIVNLSKFLEELKQEVFLLKKDNQQVEFSWCGEVGEVITDSQILKNILLNLISNAIKYSKSDGIIRVKANVMQKEFKISVIDEGMGIPEEEQKFIFQRFFRAHNVSGTQGTGLGLNIVRKYMKLLHGRIEFNSALNQGTTFTVVFPSEVKEVVLK